MDDAAPGVVPPPARLAAGLAAGPAIVAVVFLVGWLVALGPIALLVLPLALPPLALFYWQARAGLRVRRGRSSSAGTLAALSLVIVALLIPAAIVGWPGPTSDPVPISRVARSFRLWYVLGALFAIDQLAVVFLLAKSGLLARHPARG